MKTTTLPLRCTLTQDELVAHGKRAADFAHELVCLEDELKDTTKALKSRIAHIETESGKLQGSIRAGYEYRDVECGINFDSPEKGKKTIIRMDTGEEVAVEHMDDNDRQITIDEVAEDGG